MIQETPYNMQGVFRFQLLRVFIRLATGGDVEDCKKIADHHRAELGFLPRPVFVEAVAHGKLLVATDEDGTVVGFVRYNHRRKGSETALYDICVARATQHRGVGRRLVAALVESCRRHGRSSIVLRCPATLPANDFYEHVGFQRSGVEEGRRRPLVIWRLHIEGRQCSS